MRPGLEYWHALDVCAMAAHQAVGQVGVLAQSTYYHTTLAQRLPPSAEQVVVGTDRLPNAAYTCIVWAEPEQASSSEVLAHLRQVTAPGGLLYAISSNRLAQRLPDWRGSTPPTRQPVGAWRLRWLVQQAGYRITALHGFHGPISIVWGVVGQLLSKLRRDDLADRCGFQMRMTYAAQGWQAVLAPVSIVVAQKV